MCGIIGGIGIKDIARVLYTGLKDGLQHRGQESAGILTYDKESYHLMREQGLVEEAIPKSTGLLGETGLGQVRYSTAGGLLHAQPILDGGIGIVHNGNLVNYDRLREYANQSGIDIGLDENPSDTQLFGRMLASSKQSDLTDAILEALKEVKPTYSMLIQYKDTLYAVRDRTGNRPLYLGKLNGGYIFASEERALRSLGAENIKEVPAGKLVKIEKKDSESYEFTEVQFAQPVYRRCQVEPIYLANAGIEEEVSPKIFDMDIRLGRIAAGAILASKNTAQGDIIVPTMNSGYYSAVGYSSESGLNYDQTILEKDPKYGKRNFIDPDTNRRIWGWKRVFRPNAADIVGKKLLVTEDTIVRGDTQAGTVQLARVHGAREYHAKIASAPLLHACHMGINFPTQEELIAWQMQQRMGDNFIGGIENFLRLRFFGLEYPKSQLVEMAASIPPTEQAIIGVVEKSTREDKNYVSRESPRPSKKDHVITDPEDFNPQRVTLDFLTLAEQRAAYETWDGYCDACWTGDYSGFFD
ncbi:MAG: hypothetical protein KKC75_06130 [Nanoarchaeota archaeon]|nr:hypothetical protein [Nanoarchaeota archaeon]MBU1005509.1 hypothetical protein [Nanoarchaeota archaeon]MBU1945766.1 hypothetical protein [Nanoarchaeota archaeon]